MNKLFLYTIIATYLLLRSAMPGLVAQTPTFDTQCFPASSQVNRPSAAFFNYGTGNRMKNPSRRMKLTVGQTVVGQTLGNEYNIYYGYWTGFLVAPLPPVVTASQGELLDRIQISWANNPLGPFPNLGFKIFRDGVFLASVDSKTRNYNDFNVIAGRAYNYEVRGLNIYGEGASGKAVGFQVPNGTVTGWIQTPSGRPVPDAFVTLTPLQGFSANFSPTDGAFARADAGTAGSLLPAPGGEWTLTFWIKSSSYSTDGAIMSLSPFPLYLRPNPLLDGIEVAQQPVQTFKSASMTDEALLAGEFPLDKQNQWNHVALTVDADGIGRLYLNGELKSIGALPPLPSADELLLGARAPSGGFWQGRLDELRIYHRRLDELDFAEVMMGTASSQTADLKYYWKMDEELGTGSFDILRRNKLFFCGATFNADRPYVRTMGKTNQQGFYRIESASYGTGTTFLADPMKDFYLYRALKFVRSQEDYSTLSDFSLTPQATLELWVNSAGPDGEQCILSKKWPGNDFRLMLKPNGLDNDIWVYLNGQEHNFGPLGVGYKHLAFTIDNQTGTVTVYHNSLVRGSHSFAGLSGDWSDPANPWLLGARASGGGRTDHFGGLIDEVALYEGLLSPAAIQSHVQNVRSPQEAGLRVYFNLDEGNGNRLNNSGSLLLPFGTTFGTEWSPLTAKQKTEPHIFTPETRQVSLNPSITSVDQVDFVDRSTVPVTGFVRYKNTDCFAPNVEILVNGARFTPGIFTDSTGKFVIDFDPGTTATITPVFEDHQFVPAFWEVTNVVNPIAGILFNDVTTRKVRGVVAGGECKKSVIEAPPGAGQGTVCRVKVRSVDGCLEREITIDNQEGEFEFEELPPLEALTVSVTEHSNPDIKTFFQVLGGSTVDLSKSDTIVDFIYFAPPEVLLNSGLDFISPTCSTIVVTKGDLVTLSISLVERYVPILDNMNMVTDDGVCPLDTANFRIINGLADETLDTTMSGAILGYLFRVGVPNPSPPYLKTLQIIGTSVPGGRQGSLTKQAVVQGIRSKLNTFTTQLPKVPLLVLRDPPGDGSSSFWEKNNKVCTTIQTNVDNSIGIGGGVSIDNGPTVKFIAAPVGVGTQIDTETKFGVAIEGDVTFQKVTDSTFQTCLSSTERIATSDGDLIVGADADVYVGVGLNLSVGLADEVTFDIDACEASVEIIVTVEPLGATAFRYSQFHIVNNVIRYLNLIIDNTDPQTVDPQTLADYATSIQLWESFLEDNADQKSKAPLVRNLSFDAGVSYEYSETSDTAGTASVSNYTTISGATRTFLGASVLDVGVEAELRFTFSTASGETKENGRESGITIGYVLADDDPGDAFSVDIALDSVYKTPVFRTVAGQSSCPWEDNTANREAPNLQLAPGSQFTAINVPANEPAVFQMNLGNLSATNEDWTYGFTAIAANNPHGAVIKVNGTTLNNNLVKYIVPFGTSIPITLTVERGPLEYEYNDLLVALVSECQFERNLGLSLPLGEGADTLFFSPIKLGVSFIRPCSEVAINVPTQGFVVLTNDPNEPGTIRRITVSGYNKNEPFFERVRVQYRRGDGDGAWLNIQPQSDVLKDDLGGVFTQFFWETTGLSDGPYELRAVAVCTGNASDRPGYSEIIRGRIDREPPSIVGVPQPSDGVYHVGDEISFTFNQHVNCDKLIPADQTQLNNVGLYDATTDQLIDISVTCFENKIVIDPTFDNKFYENRILRAELAGIEDLVGNTFNGTKFNKGVWEFFVDRNELAWLTDSLGITKFEGEPKTVTANIHNRGGYPVPFKILSAPDWLHVSPNQGTLAANEIRPINFTVDPNLAFGRWNDTIVLQTQTGQNPFFMGGDEPLPVGVRVVCQPPYSPVNLAQYQNTMNMILKVNIEGVFSTDAEDVVAAFIDNQLRGYANVQYVPQVNAWLAYLTVYGDPADMLKPLRLEVWDASECQRYGSVVESFTFQPDNIIGKTENPQVVHTTGLLLREVPLVFGWNWLSFNLAFPDNSLNAALASLSHPQNDLMRSQTAFSQYTGGWFGSLGNLSNTTMYIYRADQPDTLRMQGTAIDPATTPIPVVAGWNWIGYIPSYALPVNAALASLPAQNGDVVKSQFAFAEYLNPTAGWVGNLKYMSPPNGYQIKLAQAGSLTYPPPTSPFTDGVVASRGGDETDIHHSSFNIHHWALAPTQFEHSSTLIGMIRANGANATTSDMELGVFVGDQVRGTAQAIYIEPLDAHLFFLTTYANTAGELVRFKLYDDATASVHDLTETLYFAPNQHSGNIENPVPFELLATRTEEDFGTTFGFDVQPNPFASETTIRFVLPKAEEVTLTISDAQGREVLRRPVSAAAGENVAVWNGRSDAGSWLNSGVYTVQLKTPAGSVVRKVVLQRLP